MSDDDNELTTGERRALEAFPALTPPSDFASRVLAAREAPAVRRRWPLVAGGVTACLAAAAAAIVLLRSPSQASEGQLEAAARTTAKLGTRGTAVAEPDAAISWRISDDGAAVIDQTSGDVFYRVDPGGPFVVHTPAGDVRVTGTCFRVEVPVMNKKHVLLSGSLGAAVAAAAVITVYEGHVIADTKGGHAELVAGSRATIGPDGRTVVDPGNPSAMPAAMSGAVVDPSATREQLISRATEQALELSKLRARVAELEHAGGHRRGGPSDDGDGRPWFDPSPETLKAWADECRVRVDEPGLSSFKPLQPNAKSDRGIEPGEIAAYNAAMAEVQQQWVKLVRSLYIEATGDASGADTLSIEGMRREIEEKSQPEEGNYLLQKLARERAGLEPVPTDTSKMSPFERLERAFLKLGDQAEAALAKRLGPERARQIRTPEGWGSRNESAGCPR